MDTTHGDDDGLPWGESPIDLADEEDAALQGGSGWTWAMLAASSLALVAFNSHAIANWADQLPPNALTAPIIGAAERWHDTAGRLGLNRVVDGVERLATRWRGDPPD